MTPSSSRKEEPPVSFDWNPEYETGIKSIDDQHRELFKRLDKLTLAIYKGRAKSELDPLFDFLESYIKDHFTLEEELMLRYQYGEYPRHLDEHRFFMTSLSKLRRELDRSGSDNYLAIEAEKILSTWWKKHILGSDMGYAAHLREAYHRDNSSEQKKND